MRKQGYGSQGRLHERGVIENGLSVGIRGVAVTHWRGALENRIQQKCAMRAGAGEGGVEATA